MNAAHLHLAINHFPVIGLLFGIGVLLMGRFVHSDVTVRVGLWLLVVSGLFAIPAYLTGEPAEAVVENYPGIAISRIGKHEDAAAISLGLALLTGSFAGGVLLLARGGKKLPPFAIATVAVVAVIAAGSMVWTAKMGGEIHHPEIRNAPSRP